MNNTQATLVESGSSAEELTLLRQSARALYQRLWPSAVHAAHGDMGKLWEHAAERGWTDLDNDLGALLVLAAESGRVASPVPLGDTFVVNRLLPGRDAILRDVADGNVRPLVGTGIRGVDGTTTVTFLEAGTEATHLLVLDPQAHQLSWCDLANESVDVLRGLAVPSWSQIRITAQAEFTVELSTETSTEAMLLLRLALAARALGAAQRSHELAVEHAQNRSQFGHLIGHFQAVSHRTVDSETEVVGAHALLRQVISRFNAGGDWHLAAKIATQHIFDTAPTVQLNSHHTLAAVGYFEEHDCPWLFRRVHADVTRARAIPIPDELGDSLIETPISLPHIDLGPDAERLREEVLDALAPWQDGPPFRLDVVDPAARKVLRERQWMGLHWPPDVGGGGRSPAEVLAFHEALAYVDPPIGNVAIAGVSVAPMIIRYGTDEQKDFFLPKILRSELVIGLGYSESEAGSDLASLRTRATKVPEGWQISGQKLWGTGNHISDYILLAARTNPDAVKPQAGISLFLVKSDVKGLTYQEHRSLAGEVSCTTFWDDVIVPDGALLGTVDNGWRQLNHALAGERIIIGASVARVLRNLTELIELIRETPDRFHAGRHSFVRAEIARLAVRVQLGRVLMADSVLSAESDSSSFLQAPMAKIVSAELAESFGETALRILGPAGTVEAESKDGTRHDGRFEQSLRAAVSHVIFGGTNDIQRNLVARGIGLPR